MQVREYLGNDLDEAYEIIGVSRTLATTDMSSDQAAGSETAPCWRVVLTSSSTMATSDMTDFAASCASCFAAVVLTEVDDPVSSKSRSLSNLSHASHTRHARCHASEPSEDLPNRGDSP